MKPCSIKIAHASAAFLLLACGWPVQSMFGDVTGEGRSATTPRAMTPRDVARLRGVTFAAISPDGTHAAYLLSVPRDPFAEGDDKFADGPAYSELHVVDLATERKRPFITGKVNVSGVKWSPDGKHIYFLDKRGGDEFKGIYRIPIDGGEAVRVVSHETDISSYDLNPDGDGVVFIATEKQPAEKKELRDKGFTADVYEEDLTFARLWIARVDGESGKAADADKSASGEIRRGEPRMLPVEGSVNAVKWSPAGDRLAAAVAPSPRVDDEYMRTRVRVLDARSGEVTASIDNPGKLGPIEWSPDGRHVAVISAEDLHDPSAGRLMVAPAEGGPLKDVLPGFLGEVSRIAWQDEETVMYLADVGTATMFGKVRADGSRQKTIVGPGDVTLLGMSISRDGAKGVFIGDSATHRTELFRMSHGDEAPRRLTDSNPWLSEIRFGKQEVIKYQASDDLELDGILIRPVDEKPGTRYPLILYVHGGPEAHERNGWLTNYGRPGQVAAGAGFAVFYPNYRGSTGRGVEFSKLSQGDEGGEEFDDLVSAVDHLVEMGLADRDRVGVTGGSYGGYASAWCATALTEHFAAAVMFVGISNSISKKGTTDIPDEDFLVHTRGRLWDDKWQFYLERSPIYYVKKARTPILILHGKDDTRVNPAQSLELYRHLRTIGEVPVRLVWYPGEGHGNRKAAAQLDYNIRMMQWMTHYLKGPGGDPPPMEPEYGLPKAEMEDAPTTTKPAKEKETLRGDDAFPCD